MRGAQDAIIAIARTRYPDAQWECLIGHSDEYRVRCCRGEYPTHKFGLAVVTVEELRRRQIASWDTAAMGSFICEVVDMAYRNAGPPLWSSIPFRIGTRASKRLQVKA